MIISEFILAIESVLKFNIDIVREILNMEDRDGLKCWQSHRKWKMKTACQVDTNGRLAKMFHQEEAYKLKNIVVSVQKLNILKYRCLFATTRYSVE